MLGVKCLSNRMRILVVLVILCAIMSSASAAYVANDSSGPAHKSPLPADGQAHVHSVKSLYNANEPITVKYRGFPGNATDWITIVPVGAPDHEYKEWHYTNGQRAGTMSFSGLPAGTYEIRVYYDWEKTQTYDVKLRSRFRVGMEVAWAKSLSEVYAPHQPITVEFGGFPGNNTDWITVVPVGTPDNVYKEWFYTNGRAGGRMTFQGLPAGEYEVRTYFNWEGTRLYQVETRYRFSVR